MSVTFLFVPQISWEPRNGFAWTSLNVKVKGQGYHGQNQENFTTAASSSLTMHCKARAVLCSRQMTHNSRRDYSLATGGDGLTGVHGDGNFRQLACGICLVKYL